MREISQTQKKWDREEVVLLVVTYFRTKNQSAESIQNGQQMVSSVLRKRYRAIYEKEPDELFRNLNGIIMQSGRVRCLDPDTPYSGMKPTKLQKEVFAEFSRCPAQLIAEAYDLVTKYY